MLIAYLLGILTADQYSSPYHQTANPRKDQTLPDRPLPVVCVPPPLTNEEAAEKKEQKRRKTIKFWVEIAGVVILSGYFFFTMLIWCANKKSADAAEHTLANSKEEAARENRALLWIADFSTPTYEGYQGGSTYYLYWRWSIVNYGKTPAIDVHITQKSDISGSQGDCWEMTSYPSHHADFDLPAPVTPNGIPVEEVCNFGPNDGFQNNKMWFDSGVLRRGVVKLRITIRYSDVYQVPHASFICLQNGGNHSTKGDPGTKPEFCDPAPEERSCIDTDRESCHGN